jgi:hypothetical protein
MRGVGIQPGVIHTFALRWFKRRNEPDHLWKPLFFASTKDENSRFEGLASATGWQLQPEWTKTGASIKRRQNT